MAWGAFGEVGDFFRRGEVDPFRVEGEKVGGHAAAQEVAVVSAKARRGLEFFVGFFQGQSVMRIQ